MNEAFTSGSDHATLREDGIRDKRAVCVAQVTAAGVRGCSAARAPPGGWCAVSRDLTLGSIRYRDDSVLHDGLSASYDHAHDLLRDLGGHIHALRAQTLSLLQFHESLDSRRHERSHFPRGNRSRHRLVPGDYFQLSRTVLMVAST